MATGTPCSTPSSRTMACTSRVSPGRSRATRTRRCSSTTCAADRGRPHRPHVSKVTAPASSGALALPAPAHHVLLGGVEGTEPGRVVGTYRLVNMLGRGGMGVVYRARDLRLDRTVALKLLSDRLAHDQRYRERFLRERRAAASIEHPNVL